MAEDEAEEFFWEAGEVSHCDVGGRIDGLWKWSRRWAMLGCFMLGYSLRVIQDLSLTCTCFGDTLGVCVFRG